MVMSRPVLSSARPLLLSSSQIPLCRVIRFNIDYTIHFIEEMTPEVSKTPLYLSALSLPFLTPFLFLSQTPESEHSWATRNPRTSAPGWAKVLILSEEGEEILFNPLKLITSIRRLVWWSWTGFAYQSHLHECTPALSESILCSMLTKCCYQTPSASSLQNYCVRGLELFAAYLFQDILELYDWNLTGRSPHKRARFNQEGLFSRSRMGRMCDICLYGI